MELSNEFEVAAPLDHAWAVLTDLERIAPCLPGAQLQEVEGDDYRGIVKIKVGPITAQYKGSAKFVTKDDDTHHAVLTASGRDTRGQGNATANITAQLVAKGGITHVSVLTDLTITGKVAQFGRGVIGDVSAKLLEQFVENLESTVLAAQDHDTGPSRQTPPSSAAEPAGAPDPMTPLLASEIKKAWDDDKEQGAIRAPRETLPPRPDLLVPKAERVSIDEANSTANNNDSRVDDHKNNDAASKVRSVQSPEVAPIDLLGAAGSPLIKRLVPVLGALALVAVVAALVLRRRRR